MVKIAPIKRMRPAVSNRCMPECSPILARHRRIRVAAKTKKMKAMTNPTIKRKRPMPIPNKPPNVAALNMPLRDNPPSETAVAMRAIMYRTPPERAL